MAAGRKVTLETPEGETLLECSEKFYYRNGILCKDCCFLLGDCNKFNGLDFFLSIEGQVTLVNKDGSVYKIFKNIEEMTNEKNLGKYE